MNTENIISNLTEKKLLTIRRNDAGDLIFSEKGVDLFSISPGECSIIPLRNLLLKAECEPTEVGIEELPSGEYRVINMAMPKASPEPTTAAITKAKIEIIKTLMDELPTDEDRLSLITQFCKHCGSTDPDCFCARDNFD